MQKKKLVSLAGMISCPARLLLVFVFECVCGCVFVEEWE
jgi:hypothetical protein